MLTYKQILVLAGVVLIATISHAQILAGDRSFPIFQDLRWDMTLAEVQQLSEKQGIMVRSTDTSVTLKTPVFGFHAETNIQYNYRSTVPTLLQVQFPDASQAIVDSLINHFTTSVGRAPEKVTKEKSLLVVTIHIDVFMWKKGNESISVIRFSRGNTVMSVMLGLARSDRTKAKS